MPEEQVIPAETQEETAAPSTESTTTTESAAGDSNESSEGEQKARGGFQRKIDKLTREKADREREAEYWREQALRTAKVEPTNAESPKVDAKPKEDDFKTHAEYVEALTDWKVDQKVKTLRAEQTEQQAKTQRNAVESTFQEKQKEFKAATPDFEEVMADADIQVSKAVLDEIVTHDNGPALQYFLAKNPDEAKRLSRLTPLALAREVGRLESRFVSAPSAKTATVSKTPAPPNPVGKSSSTSTKDPGEMSPAEYRAWRVKQDPNFDR